MRILPIAALVTGLAATAMPAIAAGDKDMSAATAAQIRSANTASFVEYEGVSQLPNINADYTAVEMRKWLGTNPELEDDFEASDYTAADVTLAMWQDGELKLYVDDEFKG